MTLLIFLLDLIQTSFVVRLLRVRPVRRRGFINNPFLNSPRPESTSVLFHASSQGELEMLKPLIQDFKARGECVVVSVFSDSALSGLKDLREVAFYSGLSPSEGQWGHWFHHFKVKKVILAKYEFWPGLVMAASSTGIPVVLINAEARFSLKLALQIYGLNHFKGWSFFSNSEKSRSGLIALLPSSRVVLGVDPRWERVFRRLETGESHPELKKIAQIQARMKSLSAPRILLGSAWIEDLIRILPGCSNFRGTLIVVPHSLDPKKVGVMKRRLESEIPGRYLLVDEMGILVELYSAANAAFVGGGYGKGVHSTLEPALSGIPVACGPRRAERFPEISELINLKVLTVCRSPNEIQIWMESLSQAGVISESEGSRRRDSYRTLLEDCLRIR